MGIPIPLDRPRLGRGGCVFTPKRCQDAKRRIAIEASIAMRGRDQFAGPLDVQFHFEMKMPKRPKPNQFQGHPHVSTPDLSNLIKLAEDALNGIVWHDDSFIAKLTCTKFYGPRPSTIFMIKNLEMRRVDE